MTKSSVTAIISGLAMSVTLQGMAQAAGMILLDPITPGVSALPSTTAIRPPINRHIPPGILVPVPIQPSPTRPGKILKGNVSYGLRLQNVEVKVDIKDQIAKTYICQTFVNDTGRNLAGTYLFPLPDDTTFSSFSLHIDGKPVEGKILEAEEARAQYEAIVRRMVDPGLLEYADYKTVRARIFPIPAHGTKKVELEYTQVLKAENGMVRYHYPLKIEAEAPNVEQVKIDVKLASLQSIKTIWSPSHDIKTNRASDNSAKISFSEADTTPDKDFYLYYSVSGKELAANLLTHKKVSEDGYFMLSLTPPLKAPQVIGKDLILVVDTSGSMQGERMEQSKKALKYVINALNPGDRFSIVEFNTDIESFKSHLVNATPENRKAAEQYINDLEPRGGTNIGDALRTAVTILSEQTARPGFLVLLTDGEPTVGDTTIPALLKAANSKREIRLFDFGVGYDVNTRLLNKLASMNHGLSSYIEPGESTELALANFYGKIKSPVLNNVKITYEGIQVKDTYPREIKDIFAGNQIIFLGRYKNGGKATLNISGTVNGIAKTFTFPLQFPAMEAGNSSLAKLWAMRRIGHLTEIAQENGNNREIIEEIVNLSKKYGIISAYTSYLVTEPQAVNNGSNPAPVPLSWPAPAVGGAAYSQLQRREQKIAPVPAGTSPASFDERSASRNVPAPSAGFADKVYAAVKQETGRQSVQLSKLAGQLRNWQPAAGVDALSNAKMLPGTKNKDSSLKIIGDKTFHLQNGVWIDSEYNATKYPQPRKIQFSSEEYFQLIRQQKGLAKYLAAGKKVLLIFAGVCYQII